MENTNRIILISKDIQEELIRYGDSSPDKEVCGLLLGNKFSVNGALNSADWLCDEFRPLTNVSDNKEVHYIPEPTELFKALKDTTHMTKGATKDLVGVFHTHPHHEAKPSITDLTGAGYMGFYIIYSPKYNQFNAFYYDG